MKWYYLAALIWLLRILMFVSIIFIPAVIYLINHNWWFYNPFFAADVTVEKKRIYKEDKNDNFTSDKNN